MRHVRSSIHLGIMTGLLAILCGVTFAACSSETQPDTAAEGEDVREAGMTFEEFLEVVYQEPETGIYIVNGDTPILTIEELRAFYEDHVRQGALAVHTVNGVDAKWSNTAKLNLTYCVSSTFGTNYTKVVNAMSQAAGAWENAANIEFIHKSAQDSSCTASNTNVVFDVRPVSGAPYLARAFFPNYSRSQRNILIDSSAFGTISPYTLAGVLRHELGHALGFRHEHTRPEAGVCFEDGDWRALTTYDSASVMHYPQCNGTNEGDLVLTTRDRNGATSLYGVPQPQCDDVCTYGNCGNCYDYNYLTSCHVHNGCGGKYPIP
jgi:serine protease